MPLRSVEGRDHDHRAADPFRLHAQPTIDDGRFPSVDEVAEARVLPEGSTPIRGEISMDVCAHDFDERLAFIMRRAFEASVGDGAYAASVMVGIALSAGGSNASPWTKERDISRSSLRERQCLLVFVRGAS